MNEKIFTGFELVGVDSIADLELILFQMRSIITEQASIAYANLVTRHIERMVDEIALNISPRPEKMSILDASAADVRRRVIYAEQRNQDTEYNLYIGAQVLSVTNGGKPSIILRIIAPNDIYTKKLRKIKELVPLTIYSNDIKEKGSREKLWKAIVEKYETDIPIVCNLLNYNDLRIDPVSFIYKSPEERAQILAKEKVMNQLLSRYACDQEIPPNKLMEYILYTEHRLEYEESKFAMGFEAEQLKRILQPITFELIVKTGDLVVPPQETEIDPDGKGRVIDTDETPCSDIADEEIPDDGKDKTDNTENTPDEAGDEN